MPTSGSRTSETGGGGPNMCRNFLTTFFRQNFCILAKKFHLSPKISDDLFISHQPFSCFMWYFPVEGGQIRSQHRYGGGKILTFPQIHNSTIALSAPERAKLHCQLRWGGYGRICPPGSATVYAFCAVMLNKHR